MMGFVAQMKWTCIQLCPLYSPIIIHYVYAGSHMMSLYDTTHIDGRLAERGIFFRLHDLSGSLQSLIIGFTQRFLEEANQNVRTWTAEWSGRFFEASVSWEIVHNNSDDDDCDEGNWTICNARNYIKLYLRTIMEMIIDLAEGKPSFPHSDAPKEAFGNIGRWRISGSKTECCIFSMWRLASRLSSDLRWSLLPHKGRTFSGSVADQRFWRQLDHPSGFIQWLRWRLWWFRRVRGHCPGGSMSGGSKRADP